MPRILVILSSFNRPRGLMRAVQSVLGQRGLDLDDLLLAICDDGSTDPRVRNVIDYADTQMLTARYLFPAYDRGPGEALDRARVLTMGRLINVALNDNDCELVSYLTDGSEYLPSRCARLAGHLQKNPRCHAAFDEQELVGVDEEERILFARPGQGGGDDEVWQHGPFTLHLDQGNFIDHCSILERRCDVRWSEDPADWSCLDWRRWQAMAARGMRFDRLPGAGERKWTGPANLGRMLAAGASIDAVAATRG